MPEFVYPAAHTVDHVDDYHGMQIPDPYRWLEDPSTPQARKWIEAQNALVDGFLAQDPERNAIRKRLADLWDFPKQWAPEKHGGRYFQLRNTGLQNQDVLVVMDHLDQDARVLLDPNSLSDEGTVAFNVWSVSSDGRWLAYATSESGSDWLTWHVRDVDTGKDLPDCVRWSKFCRAEWREDCAGFYYNRYDAPEKGKEITAQNYFQKVYFHRLGTSQEEDQLVYDKPDQKEWNFDTYVAEDDQFIIFLVGQGTDVRNRVFYRDLGSAAPVVALISELEATYLFLGNDGPIFYFHTNLGAARGRVIAVDITQPEMENWRTMIPESDDTIELVKMVHDEFIVLYLQDAHHLLKRYDLEGNPLGEIEFPTLGSIPTKGYYRNLTGRRKDDELFFTFWSFLYPPTVYRFDFKSGSTELLYAPPFDLDPGEFEIRQVFAASKDGTQVPIFLTHRKNLTLDGNNPTLLYGYGGFNIALVPQFSVTNLAFVEMGGVLAWANLRGGAEYGEEWHQAGMLHNKQNVFDDFIACGEYLIQEKITSSSKLSILGRSNGGLLVGACMTQRPDLFGAAVPVVGVMDMLRFHQFTIGWAWVSDYGSSEDPEQFKTLLAYSPLHNLKPGAAYPPTLVVTSDHDDRVVPAHSFKFAAALQAAQSGDSPILIRVQTKAGHGVGKPTAKLIEEAADILSFLSLTLGIRG